MSEEVEDFDVEFEVLLEDVRRLYKRAETSRSLETRSEFLQNAYPLIESLIEATHKRIGNLEALVAEQIDPTESVIMPELTQRIAMLLSVGGRIAEVARVLSAEASPDALAKVAQLLENGAPLTDWINGYHAEAQKLISELSDLTIEVDEDDDEDDVSDDDDDGDEDGEADEDDEE